MNSTGKKVLAVCLGVLSALMLVGCFFAIWRIAGLMFPGMDPERSSVSYWLAVLAIPEAIFVAAILLLWRKRGPVAAGILATGLMMGLHVAVHLAMR